MGALQLQKVFGLKYLHAQISNDITSNLHESLEALFSVASLLKEKGKWLSQQNRVYLGITGELQFRTNTL